MAVRPNVVDSPRRVGVPVEETTGGRLASAGLSVSGAQVCVDCGNEKPVGDFYVYRTGRLYTRCKACHYVCTQRHRKENVERVREWGRRRYHAGEREQRRDRKRLAKYGLTRAQYDALLESQGGVCAICRLPFLDWEPPPSWYVASIDHCHDTGLVRGILHRRCNLALELMFSEEEAASARAYLARAEVTHE